MASMTAYVEWDEESKLFIGIVPGITGAHTQGATLEELEFNLSVRSSRSALKSSI